MRPTRLLMLLTLVMLPAKPQADCTYMEADIYPLSGAAPLEVHAKGVGWGWVLDVTVEFGGESKRSTGVCPYPDCDCKLGWIFDFEHEFVCPGTYNVVLNDGETIFQKVVTVEAPPELPLQPVAEVLPSEVYLHTSDDITERPFQKATVQWGDGDSEEFTWLSLQSGFRTPTHDYLDGYYTAIIVHHYEGEYCSFDRAYSVSFEIPLPANPVEPTTWGKVKALYR